MDRYSFGENNIWTIHDGDQPLPWLNSFTKRVFGIRIPPIRSVIPHNTQITTVFGAPIPVTKCEHPSEEEVNRVHEEVSVLGTADAQVVKQIQELFAKYKPEGEDDLVIEV